MKNGVTKSTQIELPSPDSEHVFILFENDSFLFVFRVPLSISLNVHFAELALRCDKMMRPLDGGARIFRGRAKRPWERGDKLTDE